MAHPHNSGSTIKLCTMKGAHRYTKILLVVFWEKISFGANLIFLGHFLLYGWTWSELRQVIVAIVSLNSQDMISFMITNWSLKGHWTNSWHRSKNLFHVLYSYKWLFTSYKSFCIFIFMLNDSFLQLSRDSFNLTI